MTIMKTIILNNWKTSLIGLTLIAAGLYTGLSAKQSWAESGPIIVAGIGLLFSKDAGKTSGSIINDTIQKTVSHD
jgi:hypothetical protein